MHTRCAPASRMARDGEAGMPHVGRTTDGYNKAASPMSHTTRFSFAAALLAAVAFFAAAMPAHAQRLSLAERVAKLEQQQQGGSGAQANIELVNQINALQSQVQMLQ